MKAGSVPLLQVESLSKVFAAAQGGSTRAVDGVSFHVDRGETLGIVGESGSGKSTLGRLIAGLQEPSGGRVLIGGEDVHARRFSSRQAVWRQLQMVFQDPYSSLNPRMTIEEALAEPLRNFRIATGAAAKARAVRMLDACGLPASSLARYPSDFSGGQRQRIGIARALIVEPALVIADEPVSALDVSVQAQIINLLLDLQESFGLTYIFIGHDLAVVRQVAARVAVMYRGRIEEIAAADTLFTAPQSAYTKLLLAASPSTDPARARQQLDVQAG